MLLLYSDLKIQSRAKHMLKVVLPIFLITLSANALASSPVLTSEGGSVPAAQAIITNDTVQQANLNAQIAKDTVNMKSALNEINTINNTNAGSSTVTNQVGNGSKSKDNENTQDASIDANMPSNKSTTDN